MTFGQNIFWGVLILSSSHAYADRAEPRVKVQIEVIVFDDGDVEVLVSTMVDGNRELIAGLNDDPQFGLTIMLGVGGILAEAIRDVVFRLVPITEVDAGEMIDDLATQRLLEEFRGEPAVDRQALVEALVALAEVGEQEAGVRSIDLNPMILVDGKPVAVDALIEIDAAEASR